MSRARTRPATATVAAAAALACVAALTAAAAAPAAAQQQSQAAATGARTAAETIRQIPLQGAVNVRDLGGYRTWTGGRVRQGLVYRSDALNRLTPADLGAVSGLGLAKVVDFRIPLEVQYDGPDRLPAGPTPVSRPVSDLGLFATLVGVIGSGDPARQEEVLGGGRAEAYMREVYRTFVTSPANRAQFGETLRELAQGSGPLLFHCTSGKDRTGWLSYVLLRALAVPEESAERDYLASNAFRAAYDARVREALRQSGRMQDPDLLIPLQEVRVGYLDAANTQLEADYGGFYGYLADGLGLDLRTLAKLRSRLVR
ncbi:tyrosine-protein phosphatase [Streptomyces sp. NPDC004244]